MRPQQQNRRMRGRNNNGGGNNNNNNSNRRGPNPLTRNYESNGPDVKIRGSAQQIAEKYAQLARDAHSSGDRVMAENYLQHAEHYNRIIAAAQAQMPIQQAQNNRDLSDDEMDDEREEFEQSGNATGGGGNEQQPQNLGTGPQPVIDGTPAEVALNPEAAGEGNDQPGDRQPNGVNGSQAEGEGFPPRRGRRPRRSRGERNAESGESAEQNEPAPVEPEAGKPALVTSET